MNAFCSLLVLVFVASSFVQANEIPTATPIQLKLKDGPIVGVRVALQPPVFIDRFLAIPYAKPPIGLLRFRRPQPPDPWRVPLMALTYPNNCIQRTNFNINITSFYNSAVFSEDCLYLNVWSPDAKATEQHLRPVLVFIHGGGLVMGSSTMYDSIILSAKTNAVVVTINYRLSTLGFLYSSEVKDVGGNQAFWDQALALEWIQDNIRYFGGDPNFVTLIGQSAGSLAINAHILSPISRNLFRNAIMMSGAATYGVFVSAQSHAERMLPGIRQVGCATESDSTINRKVVQCLQNLDANLVDQIYYSSGSKKLAYALGVVDGDFMPAEPEQMMLTGDHKKNFHILMSTVEDEGSYFLYYGDEVSDQRFDPKNPTRLTLEEAKEVLNRVVLGYTGERTFELATRLYFNGFNGNYDSMDLFRRQVGIAYGDLILNCPSILFARDIFRSSPETIKIYQVYFKFKLGQLKTLCSQWGGTCHGDELPYLFGQVFSPREMFTNRERDVSDEITSMISSFIRTGEPGKDHSEWQPYFITDDGQNIMGTYYELGNNFKTHRSYGFNLKHAECEYLWRQFYHCCFA